MRVDVVNSEARFKVSTQSVWCEYWRRERTQQEASAQLSLKTARQLFRETGIAARRHLEQTLLVGFRQIQCLNEDTH